MRYCLLLICLLSTSTRAQWLLQGYHGLDDDRPGGVRFGYHNEDPDFFWRSQADYTGQRWQLQLDWVIPIPGSYSTAFIGTPLSHRSGNAVHAGIVLLHHLEWRWQWQPGVPQPSLALQWAFSGAAITGDTPTPLTRQRSLVLR